MTEIKRSNAIWRASTKAPSPSDVGPMSVPTLPMLPMLVVLTRFAGGIDTFINQHHPFGHNPLNKDTSVTSVTSVTSGTSVKLEGEGAFVTTPFGV